MKNKLYPIIFEKSTGGVYKLEREINCKTYIKIHIFGENKFPTTAFVFQPYIYTNIYFGSNVNEIDKFSFNICKNNKTNLYEIQIFGNFDVFNTFLIQHKFNYKKYIYDTIISLITNKLKDIQPYDADYITNLIQFLII